jgi:hypothetical protein
MHKSATKCNETIGKWCKNKHGASKIIDTFETYQRAIERSCLMDGWEGEMTPERLVGREEENLPEIKGITGKKVSRV